MTVETREAGPGNLEVTVNQGRVGTTAHTQGPHTYAISFTPRSPSVHTVHLKFNQHDVPGIFFLLFFLSIVLQEENLFYKIKKKIRCTSKKFFFVCDFRLDCCKIMCLFIMQYDIAENSACYNSVIINIPNE